MKRAPVSAFMALVLLGWTPDIARAADSDVQVIGLKTEPRHLAVSPSGNQIAWITPAGLSIHSLYPDGRIGDVVRHMDQPGPQRVIFTENGRKIVVAGNGWVNIIERGSWETKTIPTEADSVVSAMETVTQRPWVYVQCKHPDETLMVDFRDGTIAARSSCFMPFYQAIDMFVTPDGNTLLHLFDPLEHMDGLSTKARIVTNTPTDSCQQGQGASRRHYARAIACGPDPDHMLMIEDSDQPLVVIRVSDMVERCAVNFNFLGPNDVACSRDGRFVAVSELYGGFMTIISGQDLRGVMDPDFDMPLDRVRTKKITLRCMPDGVALNPVKDVAYVWSSMNKCVAAVHMKLPRV
ncbi:MAG: hypothetical protein J7M38_00240 [Armatimonadetes bacterium]|nr:hypothetical protein [Armatimonadota bacterium]